MISALVLCACFAGQADDPPQLSADEKAAMETITLERVIGTVSFLASDELAGRDTPSPELNIAAAYVASRLRAAGMEGLGPEGSFYQETTVNTLQTPNQGVGFSAEGEIVSHGLLLGGTRAVRHTGSVTKVGTADSYEGPVWTIAPEARDGANRAISGIVRSAIEYSRRGATALLVVADGKSALVAAAESRRARPRMTGRRSLTSPIPILLVSAAPERPCSLQLPAEIKGEAIVRNVIGCRRGSDPELAKQAVLFSAHLDHIGRAAGEDPVNNGADDDASGVTAVLGLADAYGALKWPTKRSAIFMTFWGEEKGLVGSRYFAEHPLWPLEQIVANINIEMVGRPERGAEKTCWMTGWDQSDLGQLMNRGSQRAGVKIFEHPRFSKMLYRASDNASFVRVGVIGHSFSAGSLHEDYHQPGDEWRKLQGPHMTTVIRGLFAGSLPIAHGQFTPTKADK